MSALLIDFGEAVARRRRIESTSRTEPHARHAALDHDFKFWRGASGLSYVHTVYATDACPSLPMTNVVLVRRHACGRLEPMHATTLEEPVPQANLTAVTEMAQAFGANEIHVHLLAGGPAHRALIARDIIEGLALARSRATG